MSATGLGGCHAVRVRGSPCTPMSNKLGRVSRAGFVVSQILRSGRVSRDPAPWSPISPMSDRG